MLEVFMFAAKPFDTWGPGPIPETVGYWARIFDSVANDPQAVATIIAAFLGFLFGVLIKYRLDRRADRLRRETDRRILMTALRAELVCFDQECFSRIDTYEKLLKENPEKEVLGGPWGFDQMALPPRRVWMAHLGRIGELEDVNPDSLVLAYSCFDSYDLNVGILKQRTGDQGVNRDDLQKAVDILKNIRKVIVEAGGPLVKQTKVRPSWWRRLNQVRPGGRPDQWFLESAAAIQHSEEDWVSAREMVSDFGALNFTYNDEPMAVFDQDKRHDFLMELIEALNFFAKGKLLRQQPKAVYLPNLRARMHDEHSYQLSNFGAKLLRGRVFLRRLYISGMLVWFRGAALLKRDKWVIGVIS